MSYVVLARKWRPMRFEDLVGQDHVARTLGNAIDAGRVAHAFLFTGVRGVGKTTSARILAKALNCMRPPGSLEAGAPDPGPTVTPCLQCPACKEIAEGRDVDVQEIDGASYNGVDEVRKLQDSLPYRPQRDRYKIVIVDEVHMLTQAAWNAFLKTLEEPPPHVKFIFATTEVHKVPITILSRVQRFDFKMIPTRLIIERLRWVLEQEDCSADDAALTIVARQAAGSMRDAMSLLDQVIAFSGQELHGEDVARVLGVASRSALLQIARALTSGDAERCLSLVGTVADQGFDIPHVTRDILSLLRDLVVAKVCKSPEQLLDAADEERNDIIAIANECSENDLMRLHTAFGKGFDDVVRSADSRAGLEMLLVRLAHRPALLPIDELLHRIGHLEKRLSQAARGAGSSGSSGAPQGQPPKGRAMQRAPRSPGSAGGPKAAQNEDDSSDGPSQHSNTPAVVSAAPAVAVSPPSADPKSAGSPSASATTKPAPQQSQVDDVAPWEVGETRPVNAQDHPNAPWNDEQAAPHKHVVGQGTDTASAPLQAAPTATAASPAPAASAPTSARSQAPMLVSQSPALPPEPSAEEAALLAEMMKISEVLRQSNMELCAYFDQAVPLSCSDDTLLIGLEKGHVFEGQLTKPEAHASIEAAIAQTWGRPGKLVIERSSPRATADKTLSAERARQRTLRYYAAVEEVKSHPKVIEAIRIFGAQVRNVSLAE